jgi:hemerythrin
MEFEKDHYVDVEIIDEQHKAIADQINLIYKSILVLDKKSVLIKFKSLLEKLEIHFETEERLMKETRFLGYFSHKLEHDRFYNQMLKKTEQYAIGIEQIGTEQLKGIRNWFFNHIELNDRKCSEHLAEHGITHLTK